MFHQEALVETIKTVNILFINLPDIILCVDKKTNKFVEPKGFEAYILGDIMKPYDTENYYWYAIVPVGRNNLIRNTLKPSGLIRMKVRHLQKIGYTPILVKESLV